MVSKANIKKLQEELTNINKQIREVLINNDFEESIEYIGLKNKEVIIESFFGIDDIEQKNKLTTFIFLFWFQDEKNGLFNSQYSELNNFSKELTNMNIKYDRDELISIGEGASYTSYLEFKKEVITPLKRIVKNAIPKIEKDLEQIKNKKISIKEEELEFKDRNGARIKKYEFETEKNLYKLKIIVDSYDFQSSATLSFFNGDKWERLVNRNPTKDYGIDISYKDETQISPTIFNGLRDEYIKFIEDIENPTKERLKKIYTPDIQLMHSNDGIYQQRFYITKNNGIYKTEVLVESYETQSYIKLSKLTNNGFELIKRKNPTTDFNIKPVYGPIYSNTMYDKVFEYMEGEILKIDKNKTIDKKYTLGTNNP